MPDTTNTNSLLPTSDERALDFLHDISERMAEADALEDVLARIVDFLNDLVAADSCLIYVLEGKDLVLRASQNAHPALMGRLTIPKGEGVTGWVAANNKPVAISEDATSDPRFRRFEELQEDAFAALLSVPMSASGRVIGVINLQHAKPHEHTDRVIKLVATIGHLAGAEVERARLDSELLELAGQLETRNLLENAKGILQRNLRVSEEAAYRALQQESRRRRIPMKQVAEAVVLASELRESPAPGEH